MNRRIFISKINKVNCSLLVYASECIVLQMGLYPVHIKFRNWMGI